MNRNVAALNFLIFEPSILQTFLPSYSETGDI